MRKSTRFFSRMSLLIFAVVALVVLALPSAQAQKGDKIDGFQGMIEQSPSALAQFPTVPAPNDRCANPQDVAVPSGAPRSTARSVFFFNTSGATAGPLGVDVVASVTSTNDVWFRIPSPPCSPMKVQINTTGSSYPAGIIVITEGGGLPFFVCDVDLNGTGDAFFDGDFVILDGLSLEHTITDPTRDYYYLIDDGSNGVGGNLFISIQSVCL